MDRIKIVAVALTTLMCTGCESGTNIEGAADVSPDCDAGECSQEFEKPPLAEEYESPASKLSVESDAYRQIAVEPRPFMRPGEDGAKAWLYSDESAIFDTSFLFDPRDIGEDFEEQEFVMYAFVNFRPVPFSVIRANSGNNTEFASEQALSDKTTKKVQNVDFGWSEVNNYAVRIPSSSFGSKGVKVVHLAIAEANPTSADRPYAAPGSLTWGLEVHFGSYKPWRDNLPTLRAPMEKVNPLLLNSIFRTMSLMVPRPPVFDLSNIEYESFLDLGQRFDAPAKSIDITHFGTSMKASRLDSSRIIVTYLKNRDQVVGGSPVRLDADPRTPIDETQGRNDEALRFQRTIDISVGNEPLRRLDSVRFVIPDRDKLLGGRSNFGNTLYFE